MTLYCHFLYFTCRVSLLLCPREDQCILANLDASTSLYGKPGLPVLVPPWAVSLQPRHLLVHLQAFFLLFGSFLKCLQFSCSCTLSLALATTRGFWKKPAPIGSLIMTDSKRFLDSEYDPAVINTATNPPSSRARHLSMMDILQSCRNPSPERSK